jgi:hypothetical protein
MKNIEVTFDNNKKYVITTQPNSISDSITSMLKHLTNVPLEFHNFDNPYRHTYQTCLTQLVQAAKTFDIPVDVNRLHDQSYLNYLHTLYENGYNGNPDWLQYHEGIHLLELLINGICKSTVNLGYKEKAGPLKRNYTYDELSTCQIQFSAGDCFVEFNELGKIPYHYWADNEPDDIQRFCELSKPMLSLNFKITVALQDINAMPADVDKFNSWFSQYKSTWCQHWNIPDWTMEQMMGGMLIGKIDNITGFDESLGQGYVPIKLGLVDAVG